MFSCREGLLLVGSVGAARQIGVALQHPRRESATSAFRLLLEPEGRGSLLPREGVRLEAQAYLSIGGGGRAVGEPYFPSGGHDKWRWEPRIASADHRSKPAQVCYQGICITRGRFHVRALRHMFQ